MPESVNVPAHAPGRGLAARVLGILTSPRQTVESLIAAPKWIGVLVATTTISVVLAAGFLATPVGRRLFLEQMSAASTARGRALTEQETGMMERMADYAPYAAGAAALVGGPAITLGLAGLAFLLLNALRGFSTTFQQAFSVAAHAAVVLAVGQLVGTVLRYFKQSFESSMDLTILLPMIDVHSYLGRLLGYTDLFRLWWLAVLAIGFATLYRMRTRSVAVALFVAYAVFAFCGAGLPGR